MAGWVLSPVARFIIVVLLSCPHRCVAWLLLRSLLSLLYSLGGRKAVNPTVLYPTLLCSPCLPCLTFLCMNSSTICFPWPIPCAG